MSASPSPPAAGGDTKQDQIHFRFCRECSNLLYPKEDRTSNRLMFTCRTCHVSEPASSYCVYQHQLNSQVGDTAGVTQDVGSDPTITCFLCDEVTIGEDDTVEAKANTDTAPAVPADNKLPRANKPCPSCSENEAVFFQSQQRSAETGMKLYYVCCACGNVFM